MTPEGGPTHAAHPASAPLPGEAATRAAPVRLFPIGLALQVIPLHGPQGLVGEWPDANYSAAAAGCLPAWSRRIRSNAAAPPAVAL